MSETKFTPGPWNCSIKHDVWGNLVKHVIYVGDNPIDEKKEICIIYSCQSYCSDAIEINKKYDEQKSNAHLIAAAPDLYEALANLKPYLDSIVCYASTVEEYEANNFVFKAESALKKARGEIWL